jgi:hypothetical protein
MDNEEHKKKMSFTRLTNLLYEASSSLVPGTGELYNTQYTGDASNSEDKHNEGLKG